jgi:hypothetical protein
MTLSISIPVMSLYVSICMCLPLLSLKLIDEIQQRLKRRRRRIASSIKNDDEQKIKGTRNDTIIIPLISSKKKIDNIQ